MTELQKRIISALAMAGLVIGGVMAMQSLNADIVGSIILALVLGRLGYEWSFLVPAEGQAGKRLLWSILLPVSILAIQVLFYITGEYALYADFYALRSEVPAWIILVLSTVLLAHLGYSFFRHFYSGYTDHSLSVALAGIGYISLGGIAFTTLWKVGGLSGVYFIIILVIIADSAAYFGGKKWGRRKLCPSISPGKTWAGVFSAFVGCGAFYAFTVVLLPYEPPYLWFCFPMIVFAMIGDLYISLLKRRSGLKDVAHLIPGHGGLLDRLDSHLMAWAFVITFSTLGYMLDG